jgi:hypothetical protein
LHSKESATLIAFVNGSWPIFSRRPQRRSGYAAIRFLYGPRLLGLGSTASTSATISPIDQACPGSLRPSRARAVSLVNTPFRLVWSPCGSFFSSQTIDVIPNYRRICGLMVQGTSPWLLHYRTMVRPAKSAAGKWMWWRTLLRSETILGSGPFCVIDVVRLIVFWSTRQIDPVRRKSSNNNNSINLSEMRSSPRRSLRWINSRDDAQGCACHDRVGTPPAAVAWTSPRGVGRSRPRRFDEAHP